MKKIKALSTAMLSLIVTGTLFASSHREAPLIKEDPTADGTDLYAFRSPDNPDTVTILANYIPMQEPAGGPNFYSFSDSAIYEIHIDNNGDAREDITYRFQFRTERRNENTFLYNTGPVLTLDSPNLNVRQLYAVTRVTGGRGTGVGGGTSLGSNFVVAPYNIGPKSTPDYAALANAAIGNLSGNGGRVFAGPRDDSFFVDLGAVFDLLTLRPIQQLHRVPPMAASASGVDALRGFNVHTIAIQVPISQLVSGGAVNANGSNAVIGMWTTASRPRLSLRSSGLLTQQSIGGFSQVSRLGNPLVNEVVIPLAFKDVFNASEPRGDAPLFNSNETFRNRVLDPEAAKLMNLLYGVDVPAAPRNDLVQVFLTGIPNVNQPPNVVPAEMLRLNVSVPPSANPNRLGALANDAAGFPNGRRLGDDVVDIALRVVAGVLVPGFNKEPNNMLTDGVDANERPFLSTFPYAALPHQGFESRPHPNAGSATP